MDLSVILGWALAVAGALWAAWQKFGGKIDKSNAISVVDEVLEKLKGADVNKSGKIEREEAMAALDVIFKYFSTNASPEAAEALQKLVVILFTLKV
jgi:hypothetical protein